MLVPGAGPWVLLGSVITDADLEPSAEMRRGCGTCTACIPACPTGAIIAPGVLDARRCLSAILQSPGWIPAEIRTAVGDRLYGCDDCLDACPPGDRLLALATNPVGRVDVYALLGSDDAALAHQFRTSTCPATREGGCVATRSSCWATPADPVRLECSPATQGIATRCCVVTLPGPWAKSVMRGRRRCYAGSQGSDPDEQVAAEATAALDGTLPG